LELGSDVVGDETQAGESAASDNRLGTGDTMFGAGVGILYNEAASSPG